MAWFPIPDKPDWEYSTDPNLDKKAIDHYDYDNDAVHDRGKKKTFAGEKFVLARQMFNQHPGYGEIYVKDPAIKALFATRTAIVYDPQDLTTMYQDIAGTLPAYRPGTGLVDPPVGLMLDKSQGMELGPELMTNGDFSDGSTGWFSFGVGWSVVDGRLTRTNTGTQTQCNQTLYDDGSPIRLKRLAISLDVEVSSGTLFVLPGGYFTALSVTSSGHYEIEVFVNFINGVTSYGDKYLYIRGDENFAGSVDDISIREVKGYHAYQNTPTARPTLSGRYNLLTATDNWASTSWLKSFCNVNGNELVTTGTSSDTTYIRQTVSLPSSTLCKVRVFVKKGVNISDPRIRVMNTSLTTTYSSVVLSFVGDNPPATNIVSGVVGEVDIAPASDGYYKISFDFISGSDSSHFVFMYASNQNKLGSVYFKEIDLRVKRDGSSLPAYQAVTSATVYDTAGFPLFLKRDKVDDDLIVQAPAITGAWAHGTIDGPVLGTVAIPAGEYHPFGTVLNVGLPDCTQWIAIDGTLSVSEQAVFERSVYSKARQLIGVKQFGGVSSLKEYFRGRADIKSVDLSYWDTSNVTSLYSTFQSSGLTSLDLSTLDLSRCIAMYYFAWGAAYLDSVVIDNSFGGINTGTFSDSFYNTSLDQESVDAILIALANTTVTNGSIKIANAAGATNPSEAPSVAGEAAIMALRARGWTVTVTGGFAVEQVFSFGLTSVASFSFDLQTKADTTPVLIDWGDGTQSTHAGTTDQTASHTYAVSGTYAVKVYGADESVLTKFRTSDAGMSGALSLPAGMTYFLCNGSNTLSGTMSLPSGMTYFNCSGTNTLTGTLSLPAGMTVFRCVGSNTLSGTLSLPSSMTSFFCAGSNTLSGTLSLPSGMTNFHCSGFNTLSGYTPSTKASNQWQFYLAGLNTMSATDVDNILIDYAAAGGTWGGAKDVTIQGNAANRTSASDAAYASLAAKLTILDVD